MCGSIVKLEEIQTLWDKDSVINPSALDSALLNIPILHAKYYRIYIDERNKLSIMKSKLTALALDKFEFFTQGETKETREKGWNLPSRGVLLKQDADRYIETDSDIVNMTINVGIQSEKVEFLKSIISSLRDRGFNIKSAIEFLKFTNGG